MSVAGGRSGIVVPVPAAESLVGPWRFQHDRSARHHVPAHITLLFPFRPAAEVDAEAVTGVAAVMRSVGRPSFRLTHVGVFPHVTWLAPEPASLFRDLTLALADRFPDCQPYGGAFGDPVPHLTVLDHSHDRKDATADHSSFVERAAAALPIEAELAEVVLLVEDADGDWSTHTRFVLDP